MFSFKKMHLKQTAVISLRSQCDNSSPPSAAYMCWWIGSALFQIMTCHLSYKQAITWTNAALSTGPLGTNLSDIRIRIYKFSFIKMCLKGSSAKWRPFCPGVNELTVQLAGGILLTSWASRALIYLISLGHIFMDYYHYVHLWKGPTGHLLQAYRQVSNIRRTLVGNEIVDHSDVVGASPVGAAPTTSSFST